MQLPVCCQRLAPLPAPASKVQRSHWQTGQGPGRVSERGEQEQQAESGRDGTNREEEQHIRGRLVLREKRKLKDASDWKQEWRVETEKCTQLQKHNLRRSKAGYLLVLFHHRLDGHWGRFLFSMRGRKGAARALVAGVTPDVFVRSPGSWTLQLWMQLAVWWRRRRCQHQSLERRHLCLQNINLEPDTEKVQNMWEGKIQ